MTVSSRRIPKKENFLKKILQLFQRAQKTLYILLSALRCTSSPAPKHRLFSTIALLKRMTKDLKNVLIMVQM